MTVVVHSSEVTAGSMNVGSAVLTLLYTSLKMRFRNVYLTEVWVRECERKGKRHSAPNCTHLPVKYLLPPRCYGNGSAISYPPIWRPHASPNRLARSTMPTCHMESYGLQDTADCELVVTSNVYRKVVTIYSTSFNWNITNEINIITIFSKVDAILDRFKIKLNSLDIVYLRSTNTSYIAICSVATIIIETCKRITFIVCVLCRDVTINRAKHDITTPIPSHF